MATTEPKPGKRPHVETEKMQEYKKSQNEGVSPTKLLKCNIEGCQKMFTSLPGLRYHLRSHSGPEKPYTCTRCQKAFKSENGLKYHIERTRCEACIAMATFPPVHRSNYLADNCSKDELASKPVVAALRIPTDPHLLNVKVESPHYDLLGSPPKHEPEGGWLTELAIIATGPQSPLLQKPASEFSYSNHGSQRDTLAIMSHQDDIHSYAKPAKSVPMETAPRPHDWTSLMKMSSHAESTHSPPGYSRVLFPTDCSDQPLSVAESCLMVDSKHSPSQRSSDLPFKEPSQLSSHLACRGVSETQTPQTCAAPHHSSPARQTDHTLLCHPAFRSVHQYSHTPYQSIATSDPHPIWHCFLPDTWICFLFDEHSDWQLSQRLAHHADLRSQIPDSYACDGLYVVSTEKLGGASLSAQIEFSPGISSHPNLLARCRLDHPFFVKHKGWCSCDPHLSADNFAVDCHELSVGDICLPPPEHLYEPNVSHGLQGCELTEEDSTAVLTLSAMAKQRRDQVLVPSPRKTSPLYSASLKKGHSSKKHPAKSKRPLNGFMLFAKSCRMELRNQYPGKDNRAISVLLGDCWKRMTADEKRRYSDEAHALAKQQAKEHIASLGESLNKTSREPS